MPIPIGPFQKAVESAAIADGGPIVSSENRECQALVALARMYFGVATVIATVSDARGHQIHAFDGALPDPMPLGPVDPGTQGDTIVVSDTWHDERFRIYASGNAQWPRFYAATALTGLDGRHLGALYLLDNQTRTLDDVQHEFLRGTAAQIARGYERELELGALRERVKALKADGELMTLALAGSGTGVWDRNVVTGEIAYSPGWKAILGYEEHEIGNRIDEAYLRLHPDDLEYVRATMQAHFDNRTESYAVEHRIRCKDGSYKWICSRGKVVARDSDGRALRMVGTTTDITELREVAAQLKQSIELLTNLTDEVPGLVFQLVRAPDGRACLPYASDGIRDIYELTPEQVVANAGSIDALIDARDLPAYRESFEHSAANLSPWHLEYRVQLPRQGLRWRQGDARPRRLADGSTLWHGFITDVTDRKQIEAELQEHATVDFLTQLPNRRQFIVLSEAELARIRRSGDREAALLMFDLDHFKALNDRWGHLAGDRALSHFAALLRAEMRAGDIAGRLGGEEFAMVLPHADTQAAIAFAGRVQQRMLNTPLLYSTQLITMTVSIGIDLMRAADTDMHPPLSRGDRALYRAKERGRNRIEVYAEHADHP